MNRPSAVIVGAGPAGLIAAETLALAGLEVSVHEAMPSPGRKFLMAGRGGLNLTHSEGFDSFVARYGDRSGWLRPIIERYPPSALTAWCEELGQPTFVGSSGRIFPRAMKASPLLRAWLTRLTELGVRIVTRSRWTGWTGDGALSFAGEGGVTLVRPDVTILALGGASWPRLGSDGAWAPRIADRGVPVAPLRASNVGVHVRWSEIFRTRFAGVPLKGLRVRCGPAHARGEAVVTGQGLEGGVIYALGAAIRDGLVQHGHVALSIDLKPDVSKAELAQRLGQARSGASLSTMLQKQARLQPVAISLLREAGPVPREVEALAALIKSVPIMVSGAGSIDRAISSAGGVMREGLDHWLMIKALPGVFVAGEMLDWDAPTGGYLLQASFATGVAAAKGACTWLSRR